MIYLKIDLFNVIYFEFEYLHLCLNRSFFTFICCKLYEKTQNKRKRGRGWQILKSVLNVFSQWRNVKRCRVLRSDR